MENNTIYYDGAKLLSLMDINGQLPEIYICTSNRSAGKSTYFQKLLVNRFLKTGKKFMLVYRFKYELDSVADKFFKDIQDLFFESYVMHDKARARGNFYELFINEKENEPEKAPARGEPSGRSCGYAVCLSSCDSLKRYSHFFSDVETMLFDEFQSETNHYLPSEVDKLLSLHTTVARGQGKQVRRVPLYMVSNPVSVLNPYYDQMGITNRLFENTKFIRGDGFVLEQGHNESAENAQSKSAFNRAFQNNAYTLYSAQGKYLNDNSNFIEKLSGKSKYFATLKYHDALYSIRIFEEDGLIYCDDKADPSFPVKISITKEDHSINYVTLQANVYYLDYMRTLFNHGAFRFKNARCKDCVLSALSYV